MKAKKNKLRIKKGDQVIVIRGDDKGTQGEVLEVFPSRERVIVEGVRVVKKHVKPTQDDQGGIREMEAPVHVSNVMLLDPKSSEPTRIGRRIENEKIVRFSKKSGQTL